MHPKLAIKEGHEKENGLAGERVEMREEKKAFGFGWLVHLVKRK